VEEEDDMLDTVQARLVQLGLLQPDASAGWEFTQEGRKLLSATLNSPHKSTITAELLKLDVIEPAPIGSGLWWAYTPQGRKLVTYLLNKPLPTKDADADSDARAVK
jgi:hypothetical protein